MNKDNKITILYEKKKWIEICRLYSPQEVVNTLDFKESLITAYQLLYNKDWDSDIQKYAIHLLNEIRQYYKDQWNQDWKYDALLGLAYHITYQQDQRYLAYKSAFNKISKNPPARLLIELARCCICPGSPPFSYDQGISLITEALKEALYTDGIRVLCNLYSLKEDKEKMEYWSKILENSNPDFESPLIEPEFLIDNYLSNQ